MSAVDVSNQNFGLEIDDEGSQIRQSNGQQVDYTSVSNGLLETLGAFNQGIKVDERTLSTQASSFQKRIFEEVQMSNLNGGTTGVNQIYTDQNRTPSRIGAVGASRWSQIFDLSSSLIVCMIDGGDLIIHVIHLTDERLVEFAHSQSAINMPLSKERQYETIKTKFGAYQSANFQFQGLIVPNVQMRQNIQGKGINKGFQYTITLATSLNLIYEIDLNPYYLKSGETVVVVGPNQIQYSDQALAQNSILRSFEITKDLKNEQQVQIFGLGLSEQVHKNISQDIGMTLKVHYMEGNTDFSSVSQGLVKGYFNQFGNVAGKLTRGLQSGVGQVQSMMRTEDQSSLTKFSMTQNHQRNDLLVQQYRQKGDEMGVVAIKVFPVQGLICAIFSDGSLRIKAACAEADISRSFSNNIVSLNLLLESSLPDFLINSAKVQITNAKIAQAQLSSGMVIGIAFQIENFGDLRKIWRLNNYQLVNTSNNIFESQLSLISQQEFQETKNPSCSVMHMVMESFVTLSQELFSTQVYIWNDHLKVGKFIDVSSDTVIVDQQSQEEFNSLIDLIQGQSMMGVEQESVRLRSAITKLYRFSPIAIQQALKTSVGGWQGKTNKSIITQLLDVVKRLSPERVKELQQRIIKEQNEHSQVLCIEKSQVYDQHVSYEDQKGRCLKELPVTIMVRPSGLSVLQEVSRFSYDFLDLSQRIDLDMKYLLQSDHSLGDRKNELWLSSLHNEDNDQQLLIGLTASIKMLISEQLFAINQSIICDPQNICQYFNEAFQNSFKYQDIHTAVEDLIQQEFPRIEAQILKLQQSLLQYFNSYLPLKARQLEAGSQKIEEHQFQNHQVTKDLLKTIEIKILKDLDRLVGVMTDIIMVQQFMKTYSTLAQMSIDDQKEFQQNFLDQALAIRFQQVLALRSVFQSQRVEIQMIGQSRTVVNQPQDSSVLSSILQQDQRFFQKITCIKQQISENAFDYLMSKYLGETGELIYLNCLSLPLIKFLDHYNFTKEIGDYLGLMPTLDQFDQNFELTEEGYLQMIDPYIQDQVRQVSTIQKNESMALLAYYRAYAAAKMDVKFKSQPELNQSFSQSFLAGANSNLQEDIFQQFVANIDDCLNFLFSPEFSMETSLSSDKFLLVSKSQVQNDLMDTTVQNDILKIIFTMQSQFSTLQNESYQLYILNRAFKAVSDKVIDASQQQKDLVLQAIFKVCPNQTQENINLKYKSCYDLENKDTKHRHIMEFIEQTLKSKNIDSISVMKQYTFDNQADMEKVLQNVDERLCYLYKIKIEGRQSISPEKNQRWLRLEKMIQQNDIQGDVFEDLQTYVKMMHLIGLIYDRCDQVSQMLNAFKKCVKENIQKKVMPLFTDFEQLVESTDFESQEVVDNLENRLYRVYSKHLQVLLQTLRGLDVCLGALGPDYILVEEMRETDVKKKRVGQKRTLEDSQMLDQSMADKITGFNTMFDVSSLEKKEENLFSYELTHIKRADIIKESLLVDAKVKLAGMGYQIEPQPTIQEAEFAAQILVEEGQTEMALELSIQFNLEAISKCFELFVRNQSKSLVDQEETQAILKRMNFENMLQIAKHFILDSQQLTPELQDKIMELNLGAQVVDLLLNCPLNSKQQLSSLYDLFATSDQPRLINKALKQVCEVDSRLADKLLKSIPKCVKNAKNLADLQSNKLKGLMMNKEQPEIDKSQFQLEDRFGKELMDSHLSAGGENFGNVDLFAIVSQLEQRNDQLFDQIEDPRIVKEQEELNKLVTLRSNFEGLERKLKNDLKQLQLGPSQTQIQPRRSLLPQNLI